MAETKAVAEEATKKEGDFSLKGKAKKTKPKQLGKKQTNEPAKVDLSKKPEDQGAVVQDVTKVTIPKKEEEVASEKDQVVDVNPETRPKEEEKVEEKVTEEKPVLQEITKEESQAQAKKVEQVVKEAKRDAQVTGKPLPENIEKLVSFIDETGGTLDDYVRLNADYSKVDDNALLHEYYRQTKPHLDSSDVSLLLEDYKWDEEVDEERDVRKKKIAYKEAIAEAKNFLEKTKQQYYAEIKSRPVQGVSEEYQKAFDFFNRYNEGQQIATQQHEDFKSSTKNLFSNEFKGFEFNVGEKKFRYGIKDPSAVADRQSDVSNTLQKFLDSDGNVVDVSGYHKAIYAAEHADTIANHFYEQGKADGVQEIMAKSKNLDSNPRKTAPGDVYIGGLKVKAVSGADTSKLKIKKRKFN